MASEQKRILKFAFVADLASAIKGLVGLERQVQETGEAAEKAQRPLVGLPEKTEEASKAAALAMKRLGLTTEAEARSRVALLENEVKTVIEAEKRGLATMTDVERAREKLGEQSRRWARLTGADIKNSLETPLERLERRMTTFSNRLSGIGQKLMPISAIATGVLAGGAYAVNGQMERAFNTENAVRAAGMDPTEPKQLRRFQEFAFAAQAGLGFQADKTGDILKDVNDKFGDFIETGAGPMVDFFEQVAPKVGLIDGAKLDAFKENPEVRLRYMQQAARDFVEGKDSIQLMIDYVAALEGAGVGAQEVAFYMEAIASDSVLYYGLLKKNAAELERLASAASETGGILLPQDLETMKEAREQLELVKLSLAGLVLTLQDAGLVDAFIRMVEKLREIVVMLAENINPDMLVWGVGFLAVLAYIAPVLIGLGKISGLIATVVLKLITFAKWAVVAANWVTLWTAIAAKLTVVGGWLLQIWGFVKLIGAGIATLATGIGLVPILIGAAIIAAGIALYIWWDEITGFFAKWIPALGNMIGEALYEGVSWAFSAIADAFWWVVDTMWSGLSKIGKGIASLFPDWLKNLFGGEASVTVNGETTNVPGFSSGGYTGDGPVGAVAGVVHGKEWVVDARATSYWGTDFLASINDMAMPPVFGAMPPEMADAGTPARGGSLSFDAMVGGQSFPMQTDANVYDALSRTLSARQSAQTMRTPAFARKST